MAIFIENILDIHALNAITESLDDETLFEDGKVTAAGIAKKVKNNVQTKPDGAAKAAIKMIEMALLKHPVFQAAALPNKFAKIMISRYDVNMAYGAHVDDAFIAGVRTDLSFTLFLSDPDSYEGGELIIRRDDGDERIKLPKGALYLYPSNSIHHVAEVKSGTRLVAVGWLQSRVRLEEQRQILFDLSTAIKQLPDDETTQDTRLKILNARNNLTRLWAE